jgi:hypothetical protein
MALNAFPGAGAIEPEGLLRNSIIRQLEKLMNCYNDL